MAAPKDVKKGDAYAKRPVMGLNIALPVCPQDQSAGLHPDAPKAAMPMPPMESAMRNIADGLTRLNERVAFLRERLTPVLTPQAPTGSGQCGEKEVPLSPAVQQLNRYFASIENISSQIDDICNRTEV